MTATPLQIPVHALSGFDPETDRLSLAVDTGKTVAEIVKIALPSARTKDLQFLRVTVRVGPESHVVPFDQWHVQRPKAHTDVVIQVVPGQDAVRSVLNIVVSIAAVALAPALVGALGLQASAIALAAAQVGLTVLGSLVVNALIPPPTSSSSFGHADPRGADSYSITGLKNQALPDGAVPVVLGTMRIAPPYAAMPYTEIVGDVQYIRALFVIGEGQVDISGLRLGETSLDEFEEVEIELRRGIEGESAVTLYPQQVLEDRVGVELTRPLVRDDLGAAVSGQPAIESPAIRTTGKDATEATIIFGWSAGLVRFNDQGTKLSHTVQVRVEQRPVDADEWQEVATLSFTAKKAEGFFRQHNWAFPARGQWQVRVTMLTDETEDTKVQQRTNWIAFQTHRPEYPLNYPKPLSLVAIRIKATHQLNGALDNFSVLASRVCLDYDSGAETWVSRPTENPASLYRYVLQSGANVRPVADPQIDLNLLEDWHRFCSAKGLTYNAVHAATNTLLGDVSIEICAAGRATKRHDGRQWGVVIDRPTDDALIIDHISPLNAWGLSGSRSYVKPPHAFVVSFQDAGNDFKRTQREIRWPGYVGEITEVESLPMPGKVYADEVFLEARRRQLEIIHRPDVYQATQDGQLRITTRGDDVMVNDYSLNGAQMDAQVQKVEGNALEIDGELEMEADLVYAVRFRHFANEQDVVGSSVVRLLRFNEGPSSLLLMTGNGPIPEARSTILIGPAEGEASHRIVTGVERTTDGCSIIRTVDAAPQIDLLLEQTEVPPWSSRVGAELDPSDLLPSAPRFTNISSGVSGTDTDGLVSYLIVAGSGAVSTSTYQIQHRLVGGDWATIDLPAGSGGGDLDMYSTGDVIQLRARSVTSRGLEGPFSDVVWLTVGQDDAALPAALDVNAVSISTFLGGALVQVSTGADPATSRVQIYRSRSNVLDRENDAAGSALDVSPQASFSAALGDTGRQNLVVDGAMANASNWTTDPGWTISGGQAVHTAGTEDTLAQPLQATAGRRYRVGLSVSDVTAGTLTPRLSGSVASVGNPISSNSAHSASILAKTGNDTLEFLASTDFDGSLDDIVAYLETAACLAQGTHFIWVEPQNENGIPGPVAGPFEINIV